MKAWRGKMWARGHMLVAGSGQAIGVLMLHLSKFTSCQSEVGQCLGVRFPRIWGHRRTAEYMEDNSELPCGSREFRFLYIGSQRKSLLQN